MSGVPGHQDFVKFLSRFHFAAKLETYCLRVFSFLFDCRFVSSPLIIRINDISKYVKTSMHFLSEVSEIGNFIIAIKNFPFPSPPPPAGGRGEGNCSWGYL